MKIIPLALTRVFLFIVFAGLTLACTDHAYDFDRTDGDVTLLGEDISIPLGQTGPLTIKSLLGEKMADYLVPLEDGTCAIQYKVNPVNIAFNELKNIDGAAPFQRYCDFPMNYDFALFNKPDKPSFNANGEADLSASIPALIDLQGLTRVLDFNISGLPAQLASLKSITLTQKSRIEVTVSIPDCLLTGGTVTPELSLDMGNLFVSADYPDGVMKIKPTLNSGNGYSATTSLSLSKFVLDPKSFNAADHTLALSSIVKFTGICAVSEPRTDREHHSAAPKQAMLHVTLTLRDIACKEIEGSFDYSGRSQVTLQLGDLAAGLSDNLKETIRFDVIDPTILLDVESNITIPFSAKIDMAARQNKAKYAEVKNIPVAFPVASPGSSASKRFRISKNPPQNPGEESIALDFTSLLSRIPDDMLLTTNVTTRSDRTAVLRLGENYRVSISPKLIIPLYFGPDTKVAVSDTLALSSQLGSLIRNNTFHVAGEIENGFPLKFSLSLVLVDEDGTALTETVHQTIAADAASDISLSLAKLPGADPTRIKSAILSFEADGVPESRPIKEDDAIQANLHFVIDGGIHLTL